MKDYIIKPMRRILICLFLITYVLIPRHDVYAIEENEIIGPDYVLIPNAKESVAQYQTNGDYLFQAIEKEGISLDSQGLLTITKEATEQEIVIQAVHMNHTITKNVNLQYSWSKINSDYKDYQIREDIQDVYINPIFTNQTVLVLLRVFLLGIGIVILIQYWLKRGGNR